MSQSSSAPGVTIECPIRWGDMDALGHVNNIVYFQYCEDARIAYFEALGINEFKLQPSDGPGMVTASLNFRKQLRYPGTVAVTANVTSIGGKSFVLGYTIRDLADGSVAADGSSVCVFVDYAAAKAKPLPRGMIERMAEIEQNPQLLARKDA